MCEPVNILLGLFKPWSVFSWIHTVFNAEAKTIGKEEKVPFNTDSDVVSEVEFTKKRTELATTNNSVRCSVTVECALNQSAELSRKQDYNERPSESSVGCVCLFLISSRYLTSPLFLRGYQESNVKRFYPTLMIWVRILRRSSKLLKK